LFVDQAHLFDLIHPGLNGAELIGKILRLKQWHPVLLFNGVSNPDSRKAMRPRRSGYRRQKPDGAQKEEGAKKAGRHYLVELALIAAS
jgi:hypothetical protein